MGRTLKPLSTKAVSEKSIFNNRFVVECCEAFHVHYRGLRILMSAQDWAEMAQGMADALRRWKEQGSPIPQQGKHIELCRKNVAQDALGDQTIQVNLNENLYPKHEGRIFSEGAGFDEPQYIHLKIRDLRLEMSRAEFFSLAKACSEAVSVLNVSEVHA